MASIISVDLASTFPNAGSGAPAVSSAATVMMIHTAFYSATLYNVTGITVGGNAATYKHRQDSGDGRFEWWHISGPGLPAGSSPTVAVTWAGAASKGRGFQTITYKKVKPTDIFADFQSTTGAGDLAQNVTMLAGQLAVDSYNQGSTVATAHTVRSGQTLIQSAVTSREDRGSQSYEAGSGTVEMGFTSNNANNSSLMAAVLNASPIGSQPIWLFSKMQNFYEELKSGLIPTNDLRHRYRETYTI